MTTTLSLPTIEQDAHFETEPREWLPTPSTLTEHVVEQVQAGEPDGLSNLFGQMGVPSLDLSVTPLSARIGLLTSNHGQGFFHHEMRGRISVPETLAPERQVWEGEMLPIWQQGLLIEPKYFSFFLDSPFAPYNPNHRRKWRAHELLHGLFGFYWNPQMTRFSSYLGARLDELMPIVHWYGLDEAFRPRCPKHRGVQLARELCPKCEQLARPYWQLSASAVDEMRETSEIWIERAWDHLSSEWDACLRELESGQRVETPRGHLNASSDAVGYLVSHWPRLTSWSFGSWCEMFLVDQYDYFSDLRDYMQNMASVFQRVVSGSIESDKPKGQLLRLRRMLQDVGYRALLAMEWLDEGSKEADMAEDALMPLLEQSAELCHQMVRGDAKNASREDVLAHVHQINTTFAEVAAKSHKLPDSVKLHFPMLGYVWEEAHTQAPNDPFGTEGSLLLLKEGIESASSDAFSTYPEAFAKWTKTLRPFLESAHFSKPGRLLHRFCLWCDEQPEIDNLLLDWMKFEVFLFDDPRRDHEAEVFAVIPDKMEDLRSQKGRLRLNQTFRRTTCPAHIANEVLGTEVGEDAVSLVAVIHGGEPSLLWLSEEMEEVIEHLSQEEVVGCTDQGWLKSSHEQALEVLFEHAFVVWLPAP